MKYPLTKSKKPSSRYKVWFDQANHDLEAAQYSNEGKFFEWACYQSTQAVEKALKSIIMHAGWKHPRTHKLSVLIGLSNNVNSKFKDSKFDFRDLEVYTFIARYPFLLPGENQAPHHFVDKDDAEVCIYQAREILKITGEVLQFPYEGDYNDIEKIESIDVESRIVEIKNKIVSEFDPEKIYLFGSYARGSEKFSTMDVLVIAETNLKFVTRISKVREITKGGLPVVQPVVYTPEEFEQLQEEGDAFLESALKESRELYSR